jgi:glycosyltransferase involved in cell wall biosynthesis
MTNRPRSLLVLGNYRHAGQHSQRLYASFVTGVGREALGKDNVRIWSQRGLFAHFPWPRRLARAALQLDRYLVAPIECLFLSADILHIADNSNAWYASFIRKRTMIVSCHDMIAYLASKGRVEGWSPSWLTRIFATANIRAMRRADRVVAVSRVTADILDELEIKPVTVIHHGMLQDFEEASPLAGIDADVLGRTYFHVGAGKFPKNSELMVAAFDQLCDTETDDIRLLLLGAGAEKVRALSRYPRRIFAVSQLAAAQIRFVYERCAALVMPSRYEGFGLPVIEAQSLGCPAISSDGGALDEVNFAGPTKLAQPIAPADLANVMMRVRSDPSFRADVVAAGRENAARFGRAEAAAAYRDLYSGIAQPAPRPGQASL